MARVFKNHGLYFVGIFSYVTSLIPFLGINLVRALILLSIALVTLIVADYLQPSLMSFRIGAKEIVLSALLAIPYLFAINIYLLIPLTLLALTLVAYWKRKLMMGNVLGTAFIASLSFAWLGFVNNSFILPSVYWLLYILCGAIYVEYKIPIRKLDKKAVQISWLASLSILILLTLKSSLLLMLLSLIEPSFRFLLPGEKLASMKDVAKLGRRGAVRDSMFIALLILTAVISIFYPLELQGTILY